MPARSVIHADGCTPGLATWNAESARHIAIHTVERQAVKHEPLSLASICCNDVWPDLPNNTTWLSPCVARRSPKARRRYGPLRSATETQWKVALPFIICMRAQKIAHGY